MNTDSPQNERVAAAIESASLGWPIVLAKGKNPGAYLGKDWGAKATTDKAQIVALFERHPEANVGVICGPMSGLIDMEVNKPEGTDVLEAIFGGSAMWQLLVWCN